MARVGLREVVLMDSMRQVASAAVKKNLGPDPKMGSKVALLRRLVAMRDENVRGRPVSRPRKPARFSDKPGYNFGPPRGM